MLHKLSEIHNANTGSDDGRGGKRDRPNERGLDGGRNGISEGIGEGREVYVESNFGAFYV